MKKFKETGFVIDKPQVGRPSVCEDIRTGVIAKSNAHSHWFQTFRTLHIVQYCLWEGECRCFLVHTCEVSML
jgi:hypothetical protein